MIRKMSDTWHLRTKMAERGLFQTSDLVPLLAERGVHLSREQVYRLVTAATTVDGHPGGVVRHPRGRPQRLDRDHRRTETGLQDRHVRGIWPGGG